METAAAAVEAVAATVVEKRLSRAAARRFPKDVHPFSVPLDRPTLDRKGVV